MRSFTKNQIWLYAVMLCMLPLFSIAQSLSPLVAMNPETPVKQDHREKQAVKKSLSEALGHIKAKFNVKFIFETEIIQNKTVSIDLSDEKDIDQLLKQLFSQVDLQVKKIDNDSYIIVKKPAEKKVEKVTSNSLSAVASSSSLSPYTKLQTVQQELKALQEKTISGTITDENDEGLPGVNVLVKNTTIGTVTDVSGKFRLSVPDEADTLVVSSVGYATEEIPIGNRTVIDISMTPDVQSLSEVVVVGYGSQEKRDITGAISSVSGEEIREVAVPGFDRAIAGKLSGVRISTTNAAPGGGNQILVRGYSSISADSDPLIVLDGFPLNDGFSKSENPLNSINPNDIESIDVLKDASATAIYGARAANGVIIITTKSGKKGKPRIEFNANYGFSNQVNPVEMTNREEYLQYMQDSRDQAYMNKDPHFFGTEEERWSRDDSNETRYQNWVDDGWMFDERAQRWIYLTPEFLDYATTMPFHNWQEEVLQTGTNQNYQLSLSGGSDNLNYMISGNYYDEEGIYPETGFKRYSARMNLEMDVTDKLKVGMRLNPSLREIEKPYKLEGGSGNPNNAGTFNQLLGIQPIYQPFDENGDYIFWGASHTYNPYWTDVFDFNTEAAINLYNLMEIQNDTKLFRNIGSIYGEYEIIDGLTYRLDVNTDTRYERGEQFIPSYIHTRATPFREFAEGKYDTKQAFYWNIQNLLTYKKNINKHSFTVMAGYEANQTKWETSYMKKRNYALDKFGTLNLAQEVEDPIEDVKTSQGTLSFIGMFGRAIYNYADRYMLTATIRRDGSAKFGSNSKWGVFPAVSAGWRISEEPFMPNLGPISNLKLRAGYGQIGNSSINNYAFVGKLKAGTAVMGDGGGYGQQVGYYEQNLPYPGLSWETIEEYNLGLDLGLLEGKIQLTTEVFSRTTTDMLLNEQVLWTTSFSSSLTNAGEMKTRGFEFSATSRNINSGAFQWTTTANLFWYRSILTDNNSNNPFLGGTNSRSYVDKTVGTFWGYHDLGVFTSYEEIKTNPVNANAIDENPAKRPDRVPHPGWRMRADVNMDGVIDGDDKTIIGTPEPLLSYGMTNNFKYKGFDLSIHLTGVQGARVWNTGWESRLYDTRGGGRANTPKYIFDNYWRPGKTDAKYATPSRKNGSSRSHLLFDASFLNISNITFGYSLPQSVTQAIRARNLRAYVTVQNAFYFTDYPGYNPEINTKADDSNTKQALNQGIDNGGYPLTRTISFGISLGL